MTVPNMSLKKNEMPSQAPDVRNKNFLEVALGYTEEQAVDEANRCLHCKNAPCVGGCPVAIDIPAFIDKVKERDFEGAYQVIARQSSLPAVCGRVCPQAVSYPHLDVYKRQLFFCRGFPPAGRGGKGAKLPSQLLRR